MHRHGRRRCCGTVPAHARFPPYGNEPQQCAQIIGSSSHIVQYSQPPNSSSNRSARATHARTRSRCVRTSHLQAICCWWCGSGHRWMLTGAVPAVRVIAVGDKAPRGGRASPETLGADLAFDAGGKIDADSRSDLTRGWARSRTGNGSERRDIDEPGGRVRRLPKRTENVRSLQIEQFAAVFSILRLRGDGACGTIVGNPR